MNDQSVNIEKQTDGKAVKKVRRDHPVRRRVLYVLVGLLWVFATMVFAGAEWYREAYGQVSFAELLFTLTAPMQGTSGDFINAVLMRIVPPALKVGCAYTVICLLLSQNRWTVAVAKKLKLITEKYNLLKVARVLGAVAGLAFLFFAGKRLFYAMKIQDYLDSVSQQSTIYEECYVDPDEVAVTAPQEKRNLILIYLESMEVAYADKTSGGIQETNLIPNLTSLAAENVSFSTGSMMNGHHPVTNTTWTMAALLGSTSGVAYNFPIGGNSMEYITTFASKLTTMGDILQRDGYRQMFLCGSDAEFGGRKNYYTQHGDYEIYDLNSARSDGHLPEDYQVWWGFEDFHLYEYAKEQLTDLAASGEPFNLTMLTVDLHHFGGYECELCGDTYALSTANVAECTDRQLGEFIEWLKQQDFYENTTVVILGDHPRMDSNLVGEDNPVLSRGVYNCFINSAAETEGAVNDRNCTTLDMFPTILASLGYTIEGNRLGLGTNLFSDTQTLSEERGIDWVNDQLSRYSRAFLQMFE